MNMDHFIEAYGAEYIELTLLKRVLAISMSCFAGCLMIVNSPFLVPGTASQAGSSDVTALPQGTGQTKKGKTKEVKEGKKGEEPIDVALFQRQLSVADAKPTVAMDGYLRQLANAYPDEDGDTVMHMAAVHGDLQLAYLWRCAFQDKFAEQLNEQNLLGQTPLHLAVIINDLAMIDFLVQNGASIQVQERHGRTPIHMACQYGDIGTLRQLLQSVDQREHGERVQSVINTTENGGLNSLLFFIHHRNPVLESQFAIIDLLFEYGADPDFTDGCSGKNLVHYVADQENVALYNYLREKYPQDIYWHAPRLDGASVALVGDTFVHTNPDSS